MNKQCDFFQKLIKDELAGELGSAEQAKLADHLENCNSCRREKELLDQAIDTLKTFEEQPVPGHFFVYEQPRIPFYRKFRLLPTSLQWASAAAGVAAILLVGFILVNLQIRVDQSRLILAFGTAAVDPAVEELRAEFIDLLKQSREEDRRLLAGLLAEERRYFNDSMRRYYQQVDTRFAGLEGRLLETVSNSNTDLQVRLERTFYQYGQVMKAEQEANLAEMSRRISQIAFENRLRDSQTGNILATIAQLIDPGYRPTGGPND